MSIAHEELSADATGKAIIITSGPWAGRVGQIVACDAATPHRALLIAMEGDSEPRWIEMEALDWRPEGKTLQLIDLMKLAARAYQSTGLTLENYFDGQSGQPTSAAGDSVAGLIVLQVGTTFEDSYHLSDEETLTDLQRRLEGCADDILTVAQAVAEQADEMLMAAEGQP